jgi:hypothetical protein
MAAQLSTGGTVTRTIIHARRSSPRRFPWAVAAGRAGAADRGCGTFVAGGAQVAVVVAHGHPGCRAARRVLRRYLNSDATCVGSSCLRRSGAWRARPRRPSRSRASPRASAAAWSYRRCRSRIDRGAGGNPGGVHRRVGTGKGAPRYLRSSRRRQRLALRVGHGAGPVCSQQRLSAVEADGSAWLIRTDESGPTHQEPEEHEVKRGVPTVRNVYLRTRLATEPERRSWW